MTSQLFSQTTDPAATHPFDGFPDAVLIVDDDGAILGLNQRAKDLFAAALATQHPIDVNRLLRFGGPHRTTLGDLIEARSGTSIPCTALGLPNRHLEARACPYDAPGVPLSWLLLIRDNTDRESHEHRLRESMKMEAVKALASHVGNDFNNVLAALSGRLEAATDHLPTSVTDAMTELGNARADLKRAARVVRQLQRVSQPTPRGQRSIDPGVLVEDCLAAVRHECTRNLSFQTEFEHANALITIDVQHIGDVIVSFLQNARDAMPDGGTIAVRTSLVKAGTNDPVPHDRAGMDFVRIDIEDSGKGIPAEVLPRIFEPFFTTKAHHGAGLGLAGVYEALKNHEGGVSVESTVGAGTTFSVYLPTGKKPKTLPTDKESRPANDEKVLIVDDETSVRSIVRRALQRQGYQVLEASDGDEGLALIEEHDDINLVILDIVMPRVSGWEVLKALKKRETSPPVIVQSGYAAGEPSEPGIDADAFLGKPYDLIDLMRVVREVLDGSYGE